MPGNSSPAFSACPPASTVGTGTIGQSYSPAAILRMTHSFVAWNGSFKQANNDGGGAYLHIDCCSTRFRSYNRLI